MLKFTLTILIFVLSENYIKSSGLEPFKKRESAVCFKDFNYHASIRVEYNQFWIHHCSGAVLDDDHVITAASCIFDISPVDMRVVVGNGLFDPIFSMHPTWHPVNVVAHAYIHKRFNATVNGFSAVDYDVAIIKTEESLQPRGKYSMISPATANFKIRDGHPATMTLWNVIAADEMVYNKLIQKIGRKTNDYQCECVYPGHLSSQMICYDFDEGCYGERGAPLVMYVEGSYTLIGLYSWHGDCSNLTFPAVFTRISELYGWIQDVVTYMPPKIQCKPLSF